MKIVVSGVEVKKSSAEGRDRYRGPRGCIVGCIVGWWSPIAVRGYMDCTC